VKRFKINQWKYNFCGMFKLCNVGVNQEWYEYVDDGHDSGITDDDGIADYWRYTRAEPGFWHCYLVYVCFQALVARCEANVSEHQLYCNKVADWTDFVQSLRDKLDVCSDCTGDIRAIDIQLERLQVRHHTCNLYPCY